jgi:hypothetical protein
MRSSLPGMAVGSCCLDKAAGLGQGRRGPLIQVNRPGEPGPHNAVGPNRENNSLNQQLHPAAPHHMPFFVPDANGSDPILAVTGIFLIATVFWVGTLYWKLHSLPERMAHKSQKLQFEIVAVLGLISLFTHMHIFWVAGLLLAMIDLPDFGTPMRSIADSVERIADASSDAPALAPEAEPAPDGHSDVRTPTKKGGHGYA